MRRHKKRRGQVLVFYALMIPIFLLAGGVGLDLGWYYLNVSRLQNAADAAVVAGARIFVKNQDED
ncbi:MAG: Tad domain-containing protein, partial [Selenomonadaceae bacterium]|nr:Tad domain-containing protein [Selenomonadaceae bacterium]